MKYFFEAVLLVYFAATLANSSPTAKPAENDNGTTNVTQCNVNNNYNSFYAGPNCTKIESMFSEVKQRLAELREEIREMKGNQTCVPCKRGLWQNFVKLERCSLAFYIVVLNDFIQVF